MTDYKIERLQQFLNAWDTIDSGIFVGQYRLDPEHLRWAIEELKALKENSA